EPAAKGKDAVKKGWANLLGLKDVLVKWAPTQVEVAGSSDTRTAPMNCRLPIQKAQRLTIRANISRSGKRWMVNGNAISICIARTFRQSKRDVLQDRRLQHILGLLCRGTFE